MSTTVDKNEAILFNVTHFLYRYIYNIMTQQCIKITYYNYNISQKNIYPL